HFFKIMRHYGFLLLLWWVGIFFYEKGKMIPNNRRNPFAYCKGVFPCSPAPPPPGSKNPPKNFEKKTTNKKKKKK
ncbi:hypothetical protein, partial [Enterobacter hormaechei]